VQLKFVISKTYRISIKVSFITFLLYNVLCNYICYAVSVSHTVSPIKPPTRQSAAVPADSGIGTLHRFADSGSRASSPPSNDFTTVTTDDREPSRYQARTNGEQSLITFRSPIDLPSVILNRIWRNFATVVCSRKSKIEFVGGQNPIMFSHIFPDFCQFSPILIRF